MYSYMRPLIKEKLDRVLEIHKQLENLTNELNILLLGECDCLLDEVLKDE